MDITSLTAVELGKKIKAKEISVVDAVKASIEQIEKVEKDVLVAMAVYIGKTRLIDNFSFEVK